jgi:hypothetical protein
MANKKTQTQTQTAAKDDGAKSHAKRVTLLQAALDKATDGIEGTTRSYTARAIKFRSIAPKVVEAGFAALEEAIQAGREAYAAAQKTDEIGRASRVDLSSL